MMLCWKRPVRPRWERRPSQHMDFEGYTDKDGNQITQKRTFEAQHYNDIPIPTWFVGNTSASLIAYWKDVNDCLSDAVTDGNYGQVYWQDKANSDAIATSFSDVKTQVAVQSESVSDMADPALTENINSFLTYYSGYDNNSVYGHFITQRLPYTNQDTDNVLYRDHMWEGTNRTYIIYIPDSVKSSGSPAPLVVTTHGARSDRNGIPGGHRHQGGRRQVRIYRGHLRPDRQTPTICWTCWSWSRTTVKRRA